MNKYNKKYLKYKYKYCNLKGGTIEEINTNDTYKYLVCSLAGNILYVSNDILDIITAISQDDILFYKLINNDGDLIVENGKLINNLIDENHQEQIILYLILRRTLFDLFKQYLTIEENKNDLKIFLNKRELNKRYILFNKFDDAISYDTEEFKDVFEIFLLFTRVALSVDNHVLYLVIKYKKSFVSNEELYKYPYENEDGFNFKYIPIPNLVKIESNEHNIFKPIFSKILY